MNASAFPCAVLGALVCCVGCAGTGGGTDHVAVSKPSHTDYGLYQTINMTHDLIPYGRYGRYSGRGMDPRYITIHSTSNRGATAQNHADALRNGSLRASTSRNRVGFLTWHFTVDSVRTVQHLPTNEQGEHADHSGPGNRYSIGVEICEFRNASQQRQAVDRAARLAAWLMHSENIPLSRVVPHYHWPRDPNNWHKPCPRIFMTNGRPGPKWFEFLRQVDAYYQEIKSPKFFAWHYPDRGTFPPEISAHRERKDPVERPPSGDSGDGLADVALLPGGGVLVNHVGLRRPVDRG